MNKEVWLPVVGWEDIFEVSNKGRVKRLQTTYKDMFGNTKIVVENIRKNTPTTRGYLVITLTYKNRRKLCKIHRLVAEAFLPRTPGLDIINHKDGVKTNNNVENLEWCSQLHNNLHALRTGLRVNPRGEKSGVCKYTDELLLKAINMYNNFKDIREVSEELNIPIGHLRHVFRKETRKELTMDIAIRDTPYNYRGS